MTKALLLGRMLLRFGEGADTASLAGELSAATFGPDGALWVASDELSGGRITLSRLSLEGPGVFGAHRQFRLQDYVDLFEAGEEHAEADIEGLDYADGYLWFTGSHASKRKKPKGKDPKKNLERLAVVETEPNRYLLGRVPLIEGVPAKSGQQDAIDTIHAAIERGITLLDTAPVYGFGRSVEIVGKALVDGGTSDRFRHEKRSAGRKAGVYSSTQHARGGAGSVHPVAKFPVAEAYLCW